MKIWRYLALVLGLLLTLAVLQWTRWQVVTGGDFIIYRLDRLTGRVEMCTAGGEWQRIERPKPNPFDDIPAEN